jgi:hypothetical protein
VPALDLSNLDFSFATDQFFLHVLPVLTTQDTEWLDRLRLYFQEGMK